MNRKKNLRKICHLKNQFFGSIVILCAAIGVHAWAAIPSDYQRVYNQLVKYENRKNICNLHQNSLGFRDACVPRGPLEKPNADAVRSICILSPHILLTAQKFQMDPRGITGAIMAEHSLNLHLDREQLETVTSATDDPEKLYVAFGRPMSFSFAMIKGPTAIKAESTVARFMQRPARSNQDLGRALWDPREAIITAMAIGRNSIDAFSQSGFDISNKPEIIASLYSLPDPRRLAIRDRAQGIDPRLNYIGFFTYLYMDVVHAALEWKGDLHSTLAHITSATDQSKRCNELAANMADE